MAAKHSRFAWAGKVTNPVQLGGIETSVLDNGPGRGLRIAWVNTGSPLRYKVILDRAMDIAEAFHGEHSLAWLSHGGVTAPRPDANRGFEWLYSFGGGLVTTCGLTHIGGPESDDEEERGLHGRISNMPATLESIVQPDPAAGRLDMSITATVKQSRVFGPNLELRRTIAGTLGQPVIRISDRVTNLGNEPVPHMVLYHCNFGWPLVDAGADIVWKGTMRSFGREGDDALFNSRHNCRKCNPVIDAHNGTGEACGYLDPAADRSGISTVGIHNRRLALALAMTFKKRDLPFVTNWQHWGNGEYVCALEPGTNPPIGRNAARKQRKLRHLAPGKSRTYELVIATAAGRGKCAALLGK